MTTETKVKPPTWFWIVSILALLWNLTGAMAYVGQAYMSVEDLAALSEAERTLFETQPAWVTGAFAVAVWGGTLGCIFLLLRKKWAKPIFIISLIGIIAQMSYSFFMSNSFEVYGPGGLVMPIMVLIIGIALILFSNKGIRKQWLT
ncbi:hypothetical protein PP182_07630 [Maribacter sp. PR1]|uniref:Sugar transporter n=1 Tax=Maribacter cobaltidurans TaxID=1178778 RepID=A0ABU7ISI0_9FLAO|nr:MULTISPECIES: hypothetical protein [Maribacter]MDC6388548.1 hypothetical protein [Maribacter sp. PR1]MEE1975937.1 hypothetical protein [Maribacter cobaltidurans]